MGYGGIAGLMAIESACIPLPSEVIMPFAGSLVPAGRFTLFGCGLAGAIGCVLGSIPAYYLGAYGGRPLIVKYGRYVLLSAEHLDQAERFFARRGDVTVFVARLLPVGRGRGGGTWGRAGSGWRGCWRRASGARTSARRVRTNPCSLRESTQWSRSGPARSSMAWTS